MIGLKQWQFVVDGLIKNEFLTVLDPRQFKDELLVGGFSSTEVEIVNGGISKAERMYRLMRFLRLRPSMCNTMKHILSKFHKPLLRVFEDSLSESISVLGSFDDQIKFRSALYELKEEFDILAQWVLPKMLEVRCITESEIDDVVKQKTSLSEVLAKKPPDLVFEFLKQHHPDLIHFLRAAYDRKPSNCSKESPSRISASNQHPPLQPFRVLCDIQSDQIELWSNVELPLTQASTGADLRAALARWVNLNPGELYLNLQAASVGGTDVFQVRDDKRSSWRGFTDSEGTVEFSVREVTMEQCEWRRLDDFLPSPFSQKRRSVIRVSTAPLQEFVVINEVKDHNHGQSFCESFPLPEGGTVGDLRQAVKRWMRMSSTDVLLSRRIARRKRVEVYGVKDRRRPEWEGFCDLSTFAEFEIKEVKHFDWRPLSDDDLFVAVPNRCNIIRVSRR